MADKLAFEIEEVTDLAGEWPELEPLVLEIVEYHRPWDQRELRPDWAPRMRQFMEPSDESVTLAARSNGRTVGFLHGTFKRDYGIFDDAFAFVSNAYVEEKARRSGIGTALIERFERWCLNRGVSDVILNVASGNQLGINFWERTGFYVWGYSMRKPLEAAS